MINIDAVQAALQSDPELVAASLAGDQDAFRQIVERYQTLVCSLAYSATGSLSLSEDLAQETFLTAWKDLPELREPAKLQSWLCAIVRFRISKQFRKQDREPIHVAEPLEAVNSSVSPEAPPSVQAITNEESALLWRSLESIPEIYREPLVLFYREHQSIETVAENLDLTEDAVKQRLSRGRKMLQDQVLAMVEGALSRTSPGHAFTLGVLAALPAMTISAKAATLSAAAKGGAMAKGVGLFAVVGALIAPLLALLGIWTDYRLRKKAGHPGRELDYLKSYYTGIGISVAVFVLLCTALMSWGGALIKSHPALFVSLMIGLVLGYFLVIAIFAKPFLRRGKEFAAEPASAKLNTRPATPRWEYRSRFELFGLPFIHIRFGGWMGMRMGDRINWMRNPVKAWIAITDTFALGVVFAYGGCAIAPISVGALAIGMFSFGALAAGALAVGGFSFGVWALAPFAAGWQAFGGGCALAWDAAWSSQYAIAHHLAIGNTAQAAQTNTESVRQVMSANPFFRFCLREMTMGRMITIIWIWMIPLMLSQLSQTWIAIRGRESIQRQ